MYFKNRNTAAHWRIKITGIPTINLAWSVLWRISFIVIYIPTLPPKAEITSKVFSGTRQLLYIDALLSFIVIKTAKRFIRQRYTIKKFIIINHLHRKCCSMKITNRLKIIPIIILAAAILFAGAGTKFTDFLKENLKFSQGENDRDSGSNNGSESSFGDSQTVPEFSEVKGLWVSYIDLNMSGTDYSKEAFESKFDGIVNKASESGFNTLIVQVRPFADALYSSDYFPTSHVIFGEQGAELTFDPLEYMCQAAHENNMRIEAWINPYRIKTQDFPPALSDDNPYVKDKTLGVVTDTGIYFNPAYTEVTELICSGVREILEKYPVDGIQFDDYFYPTQDLSFDSEAYNEYYATITSEGKEPLSLEDWRVENVNNMLRQVYKTVHETSDSAVFGISPQGNIENNKNLSADVVTWCTNEGYADYICPQLYFSLDNPALSFEDALSDWTSIDFAPGVAFYAGLAGYKAGSDADSGTWLDRSDIIKTQIEIVREAGLDGFILYSYNSLVSEAVSKEMENMINLLNSSQ